MLRTLSLCLLLSLCQAASGAECFDKLRYHKEVKVYDGAQWCPDASNPQWACATQVDIVPAVASCTQSETPTDVECFHYVTLVVWRYDVICTQDGACAIDWNTQRLGGWINDYKLCPCGSGGCQLLPGSRREGDALARAVRARAEGDPLAGRFVAKRNPRPAALNGARLHGPAIEVASLGLDATKPRSDLEVCT